MALRSRFCLSTLHLLIFLLPFASTRSFAADAVANLNRGPADLTFEPLVANDGAVLTVTGPDGFTFQQQFTANAEISFVPAPGLPDGVYSFELVFSPKLDRATRKALADAHAKGDEAIATRLRAEGKLPAEPLTVSGFFTLNGGSIAPADLTEDRASTAGVEAAPSSAPFTVESGNSSLNNIVAPDFVIADDLIVQGSGCFGFDCVNGESFGFDTIRLKENNLRIKFEDTSTGTFPTRDWQLTANDSASGGASKFSIEDIDGARVPFTVLAGAPSNSLFVDGTGRLGLGTSTPVLNAHIATGNTPALRLEQNGSSGFAPQTWDLAGNEANFFVRDVTAGSRLPFRIFPGAPTSSLTIAATSGNVGIGTASATANLEIVASTPPAIKLNNTALAGKWQIRRSGSGMVFDNDATASNALFFDDGRVRLGDGGAGAEKFLLAANGNLTITGSMTAVSFVPTSDRNLKENFAAVDSEDILNKVGSLPVSRWNFISEGQEIQHIGPMAQDFHSAFSLGYDDRHIATVDADGIALAAIQALLKKVEGLEAQNAELAKRLQALEGTAAP